MKERVSKKKKILSTSEIRKRKKAIAKIIAAFLATNITINAQSISNNTPKENTLSSKYGCLSLIDVLDNNTGIELYDTNGKKIEYEFNPDVVALVSSINGKTEYGKMYEVLLSNGDDITYGYIDGKYLSNQVYDKIKVLNVDFEIRKIGNQEVVVSSDSFENDNELVNEIININDKKIDYGYIESKKIKDYTDVIVGIISESNNDNSKYTVYADSLLLRYSPTEKSEIVTSLRRGDVLKQINDSVFDDSNYKWINVSIYNNETNETLKGWVQAVDYNDNKTTNCLIEGTNSEWIEISKEINSQCAFAMDIDTKEVLFEKNKDRLMSPASTTKLMTTHIISKYGNLDDTITYSKDAIDCKVDGENQAKNGYGLYKGSSIADIVKEGNTISVRDALHISLMLSDNSTTYALGEYIEKVTGESMVDLMNKEADLIGCTRTKFTNSFGYDGGRKTSYHLVTANEMAKIGAFIATNDPTIYEIIGTREYQLEYDGRTIKHSSCYYGDGDYHDDSVKGTKTGTTNKAGQVMVTIFERDGRRIIVVTMKAKGKWNKKYKDTNLIADYVFEKIKEEENQKVLSLNKKH